MASGVQRESVKSGVAYSLAGNLLYAGSQWLISTFIVKTGGAALLGVYALSMAVISPAVAVSSMNLRSILVTDASRSYKFGDYLGMRYLSAIVCVLVVAVGLWTLPGMTGSAWLFGIAICVYRLVETVPDIIQGVFQRAGKMRFVAVSLLFRTLAVVTVFSVVSLGFKRVTASFLLLACVSLVITFIYDARLARRFDEITPRVTARSFSLARLALPLTIGALLGNIHVTLPRYYLNRLGAMDVLGQFAALSNLMVIGLMLAQAMGTTLSPRMAEHFYRNERFAFLRMALGLLLVDLLICCGIFLITHFLGRQLLTWLYNSEIAAAASTLPLFVVSLGLSLFDSHFGVILTSMLVFRSQIPLQIAKVTICLLLSYTLFRDSVSLISAIKILNWSLLAGILIEVGMVWRALSSQTTRLQNLTSGASGFKQIAVQAPS